MFYATVGHSEDVETESALKEVIAQCRKELDGREAKARLLRVLRVRRVGSCRR